MPNTTPLVRIITPPDLQAFLSEENDDDYALLVIADMPQDISQMQPRLERLINKHCIYIVCAGRLAETMYDAIEETITRLELDGKIPETSDMISVVWYDHESPDEIVSGFLNLSSPETSLYMVALLAEDPLSHCLRDKFSHDASHSSP